MLFGQHDENLAAVESGMDVCISGRGNRAVIEGEAADCEQARSVLQNLYDRLLLGELVSTADVHGVIRMENGTKRSNAEKVSIKPPRTEFGQIEINTKRRIIKPRTPTQARYMEKLRSEQLICGIGPAGTGKTYLAVATAVSKLLQGEVEKIILSRPAVEAGEQLGFLPGDLREKVDPYLTPIYDALHDTLPKGQVEKRLGTGQIEIAPLAFMRGRTLSNAFILLDEAQNTTAMQMKMMLTRLGENSRMVIAGDPSQIDLPAGEPSGLFHALEVLKDLEGISVIRFGPEDVVRHPLVGQIVEAYEVSESKAHGKNKQRSENKN